MDSGRGVEDHTKAQKKKTAVNVNGEGTLHELKFAHWNAGALWVRAVGRNSRGKNQEEGGVEGEMILPQGKGGSSRGRGVD